MKVRHLKRRVVLGYPEPPHNPFIRRLDRRRAAAIKDVRFRGAWS